MTTEAVGFQIQKLLTPGQLVSYIGKLKGIERVGDDQINGRAADKYRYTRTVQTGTQAGEIKNEAFVFVDRRLACRCVPCCSQNRAAMSTV